MIEMDDAIRIVMENTRTIDKTRVGLNDVLGRVLSEDVRSDIDMPPFDKALMDGYALQGADIASASSNTPVILDVIEEIPAGTVPQKRVECGQASQIMTGAPVPDGADTVIMVEDTLPHTDTQKVQVLDTTETGRNIARLGEDVRVNQVVLQANTVIRPPEVGILAAVGHIHIEVYRQPVVGIVATGSEVVEPHHKPKPGQIRNSNGYSMVAQVLRSGAQARYLGIVEDDIQALIQTIGEGLETCDIVALSGGVSAGEYDLVQDGMRDLGVEVLFDRIRMKPGKPLTFGVKGRATGLWLARQSGIFCSWPGTAHAPCDQKNAMHDRSTPPHRPHSAQRRLSTNARTKAICTRAQCSGKKRRLGKHLGRTPRLG